MQNIASRAFTNITWPLTDRDISVRLKSASSGMVRPSPTRPSESHPMTSRPNTRHVCFLTILAAGLIAAAPASAEEQSASGSGFYFAGKGGPTLAFATDIENGAGRALKDDSATNMIGAFGMGLGYTWAREGLPLRTEIEFMNRTEVSYNQSPLFAGSAANDAVGSDLQNVTAMAKGYYHFASGDRMWSPFISGGLGLSRNAVSGQHTPAGGTPLDVDKVTYDLAWTAGAGVSLYLGNHIVNDIEISVVDLGSADWGLPSATNLHTDSLMAAQITFALRYNF